MNRTEILVFIAISAMLFACGSQDGSPAELKNGGKIGTISPFDTLKAEFNATIVDIDKLDNTNMVFQEMSLVRPGGHTKSNTLYFIGSNDTTGSGLKHFNPDIENDSIVFLNLRNDDGYVQKRAVLYYSTYPILDSPGNNTESNPDDIENLGKTRLRTKGVTFAGVIGSDSLTKWRDEDDYFKLTLKPYDSLHIILGNMRNTSAGLKLKLPVINNNNDSNIVAKTEGKTKSIEYKMNPQFINEFSEVIDRNKFVEYKIIVSSFSGYLTPYLLTVKVIEN